MDTVFFIIFRRMRQPLLSLIISYAIVILGLTLIPGKEIDGQTYYMSFFHAFYFVSYMATTIGFGEIPYEFSDAQRLWVSFSVYVTVIVWIYALGTLLSLIRDEAFQQAVTERKFTNIISHLSERFYLVCGYGETGTELVHALIDYNQHAVVVDIDPNRISELELHNLRDFVPSLCADGCRPKHLIEAGLNNSLCAGVVALTNVNETNLKIAITSKLLNPNLKVVCRADSQDVEANMESFGTDEIIDPFDTFSTLLTTALQKPCLYLLQQWLTGMSNDSLIEPVYPPKNGKWIICGFGRFGQAIHRRLNQEEIDIVIVDICSDYADEPEIDFILGRGTEADTLKQADIDNAVGLVAGTDDDANNLSIVVTALELNSNLFTIARQNEKDNQELFDSLSCDMVMNPGNIIANKIRALLVMPMLYEFLGLAYNESDEWACALVSRILGAITDVVPDIWELTIGEEEAYAVISLQARDMEVTLGDIQSNRYQREEELNCVALLYLSKTGKVMLPTKDTLLQAGDKILFCAQSGVRHSIEWNLQNQNVLEYILTGENPKESYLLSLFRR